MPASALAAASRSASPSCRSLGQRLQGARLPVDPGRVAAARPAHIASIACTTCCQRAVAAVGAQRGARLPGEHVVGQLDARLSALRAELLRRAGTASGASRQQLHRRLLRGDAGPGPRREVGGQRRLPARRRAVPAAASRIARAPAASAPGWSARPRRGRARSAPSCQVARRAVEDLADARRDTACRAAPRPGARRAAGWPRPTGATFCQTSASRQLGLGMQRAASRAQPSSASRCASQAARAASRTSLPARWSVSSA